MSNLNIEIKYALRKIDFPNCSREAIKKVENLIVSRTPNIQHVDLAIDLMAEFIFCEKDRRGNKRNTEFSSIQEMQLLDVLYDYFVQPGSEIAKNTVFLSMFGPSYVQTRLKMLIKLISFGISSSSGSILIAAGVWLQQLGCTSVSSLQLTRAIIKDYFELISTPLPCLNSLPEIAPQFTANFLTAVAEIYLGEKNNSFTTPPESLLKCITEWVSENPSLCVAAQHSPAALPSGGIAMAAITPLAGLFKWCVLAPLFNNGGELYAKLHLHLLDSVLEIRPGPGLPTAICAQHLSNVIPTIQLKIGICLKSGIDLKTDPNIQIALDRLSQAVQVSLASRCMYGNIQELITQLDQLPENKLLRIVIKKAKQNTFVYDIL